MTRVSCTNSELVTPTNGTRMSKSTFNFQHGTALSDSLTIFSLEENFLNEITDFTNETEWRQVTAEIKATEGRARFVAECGCSLTFSCETKGMVYADISFQLNPGPIVADIKVSNSNNKYKPNLFCIQPL